MSLNRNLLHTKKQKPLNIPLVWNSKGYRRGIRWQTSVTILIIVIVTAILTYLSWYGDQVDKTNGMFGSLVYAKTQEYVAPHELTEHEQIEAYIREVFKGDADKAFKLLSCENSALNPKAVNTAGNFPKGSRDLGVFQVNEYWQKTQGKFLLNWKINVEVAHQLFVENGNSFKLWTCGRRFGI